MKYLIICSFLFSGCSALNTSVNQKDCFSTSIPQKVNQAYIENLEVHLRPPERQQTKKPKEQTKFNESYLAFLNKKAGDSLIN